MHAKSPILCQSGILTPNDDEDERRNLRRSSAAKSLRKSMGGAAGRGVAAAAAGESDGGGRKLSAEDLRTMYERVIKMTAENKINKSNAWDIDIIYHMPNIIRSTRTSGRSTSLSRSPNFRPQGLGKGRDAVQLPARQLRPRCGGQHLLQEGDVLYSRGEGRFC